MISYYTVIISVLGVCNGQSLLSTHFTASKALGYKTLEYKYISIQHTTGDLTQAKENLELIPLNLKLLMAEQRIKNKIVEPLGGQILIMGEHIDTTLDLIELIDDLADKSITRDKRDTSSVNSHSKRATEILCTHNTEINITKIDTALLGCGNIILHAITIIDANDMTAVSFEASSDHYKVSNLMTSAYTLLIEVQEDLETAKERLLSLLQNTLDTYATTTLNTLFCMKENVEIIEDMQIESCSQQHRQMVCDVQLTIGKTPTLVYKLHPYRFSDCYIDRTIYMDGQPIIYPLNDRDILTTGAQDICAQAIISSNVSSIRTHCPLNRDRQDWEFGLKVLVLHRLTDEIVEGLRNNSIKIIEPPFTIREGTYQLRLDHVEYHAKHSSNTLIEPTNLPFPRANLCPPHPITSYFSAEYMSIHWPAFIFNTMLLTVLVTISIVLGKCLVNKCCTKSTPSPAAYRDQEMLRLMALSHRSGRLRR